MMSIIARTIAEVSTRTAAFRSSARDLFQRNSNQPDLSAYSPPIKQLILTMRAPHIKSLYAGIKTLCDESQGKLGYSIAHNPVLDLPLHIAMQRTMSPIDVTQNSTPHSTYYQNHISAPAENLVLIKTSADGRLQYITPTRPQSTRHCTDFVVQDVLQDLRKRACQLHLI
jgi:hypothetical protein